MSFMRAASALILAGALGLPAAQASAQVHAEGLTPSPVPVPAAGASATAPDFATQSWVIADLDTGQILAQHNPRLRLRPASTQKLLLALAVAPRLHPDQLYRADKADEVAEGNRVVLYDGLTYKVSDLLHGALLPSANDAAMALAKANGGAAHTVAQMNEEAARLGATDTHAVNPSGLDADGQLSSAQDLAVIGRAAFANPEIAAYLKLATVDFPGKLKPSGGRVVYPIYSLNRMLRDGFQGALGGKSGYTTMARRTFVAAAERDGRRLIVSMMNIGGNTYRSAEIALNWAFANQDKLPGVGMLPEPTTAAPTFARTVTPLPDPATVAAGDVGAGRFPTASPSPAAAAPTPQQDARSQPAAGGGGSGLSIMLIVLTLLLFLLVVARARVFWLEYKRRIARPQPSARRTPGRNGQVDLRTSRLSSRSRAHVGGHLVGPRR